MLPLMSDDLGHLVQIRVVVVEEILNVYSDGFSINVTAAQYVSICNNYLHLTAVGQELIHSCCN